MSKELRNVRLTSIRRMDEGRHRQDMGRIDKLAEGIEQIGLLQPIGLDPNYRLIFGARRIKAFEYLGRKTIPARIIAIDAIIDGEHAENLIHKSFTVPILVSIHAPHC